MQDQQINESTPEVNERLPEQQEGTDTASGGYQTPTDSNIRKTGVAEETDAKSTAVQESGSSDPLVEGGGNQGTEKR